MSHQLPCQFTTRVWAIPCANNKHRWILFGANKENKILIYNSDDNTVTESTASFDDVEQGIIPPDDNTQSTQLCNVSIIQTHSPTITTRQEFNESRFAADQIRYQKRLVTKLHAKARALGFQLVPLHAEVVS
jgi:hypothetical protein